MGLGVTRNDLVSALGWLVEAGVDTLVGDAARTWLEPVAAVPVRADPPAMLRVQAQPAMPAASLAIGVDSLPALIAAITNYRSGALVDDGVAASGVMLVGDAPTGDDIAAGRLFAGANGQLLDNMLASIGRDRGSAYLTNISYWPDGAPAAAFLERQLQLARPRAILALGGVATAALCGAGAGINRMRGRWQVARIGGDEIPVLPTFHPAYLLRQPQHKALAWADLCAFRALADA